MFHKTPASKKPSRSNALIYGAGINDSRYFVTNKVNGKIVTCPIYSKWKSMLRRSYDEKYILKNPSYKDVFVSSEWLRFSNFSEWCNENYIEGYHLDKDIKIKGNKIYSDSACMFVPCQINMLFIGCDSHKGKYLIGANFKKDRNKYQAKIRIDGKTSHLGYFVTEKEAHEAYKEAKNAEITRKCKQYPEFSRYLKQYMYEV